MEQISEQDRLESIRSMESSIRKLEKALAGMTGKQASTTLVSRRLRAMQLGLAALEHEWNQAPLDVPPAVLAENRDLLKSLIPSLESVLARSKPGSSQITLIRRRIRAISLAADIMDRKAAGG